MTRLFNRAELLSTGAKGGAALLAAGTFVGALAPPAAADVLPDADLAYLRLLIGTELLGADFYASAAKAMQLGPDGQKDLKHALFNETEHYRSLAGILAGSAQTAASADDFDFSYPKAAFASAGSIAKLAVELETLFLGAYLGAVDAVQSAPLRQPLARIAANQAQHLSAFSRLLGRPAFGLSF